MSDRFVTVRPDGRTSVIYIVGPDPSGYKLAKTLFELSRGADLESHFDPLTHTLAALGAGIAGHSRISCGEYKEEDLPSEPQGT